MSKETSKPRLMDGDKLIHAPDVADYLGLTTKHIRTLEQQGKFVPRVHIGPRTAAYKRSDLEAWIDARTVRMCAKGES